MHVASRGPLLTRAELRLLTTILGPGYVWDAAREHGLGDAMAGAEEAYREVRGAVRALLSHAIERERRRIAREHQDPDDRREAFRRAKRAVRGGLEALGYRFRLQRVTSEPVGTEWRQTATVIWSQAYEIDGFCEVQIPRYIAPRVMVGAVANVHEAAVKERRARVARAVIRSVSRFLVARPEANRAVLDRRVWRRLSPEVLVYAEIATDQVEPLVLDASTLSDEETAAALRAQLGAAVRTSRHAYAGMGASLMRAWCRAGFLASPAGASISDCTGTGITEPLPALIPGQGVPLAIAIGALQGTTVTLGIRADHRAGDAALFGGVHEWLRMDVPSLLAAT